MEELSGYHFETIYPQRQESKDPAVSIRKSNIKFNKACGELANFEVLQYCEILYDDVSKVVALHPVHIATPAAFNIKPGARVPRGRFITEKLYSTIGASLADGAVQLPAQWEEKAKMFIVRLKSNVIQPKRDTYVGKKRGRKPKAEKEEDAD